MHKYGMILFIAQERATAFRPFSRFAAWFLTALQYIFETIQDTQ